MGETNDDLQTNSLITEDTDTAATQEGQALGTPAYASPEQLLGRTDDVTSLSDIYSLGATLFVLLTGSISSGSSSFQEHLTRLKQGQRFSVHEVNPSIPAALEAICRHAMEIDPRHRYGSALQMADDLNHYLSGEAVSVLRDPALVRLGRWIRRRPGLAAASATGILFASLAGMAGSAVLGQKNQQLRSSNEKLVEAVEDSRAANVHALKALRTLFDDMVSQKLGTQETLTPGDRQFLENIREQYEVFAVLKGDSIESRAIRAEGMQQSGVILAQLSEEQEARKQFDAATLLYEQLLNETNKDEYRLQLASTLLQVGLLLRNAGELTAAEQTAERGIQLLAPILNKPSGEASSTASEMKANLDQLKGEIQILTGRWKDALQSYTSSRDIFEERQDQVGESYQTLSRLAEAYRSMNDVCQNIGDIDGQETYSASALDVYRNLQKTASDDRRTVRGFCWACYDRASAHEYFGRYQQSLSELSEAVVMASEMAERYPLGNDFRGLLASIQIRRASIHARIGHIALAESDLKQTIDRLETMLETSSSVELFRLLLKAGRMLALLHDRYERTTEAESTMHTMKLYGDAFASKFPEIAAQSWERGNHPYDLAMILCDAKRLDDAQQTLQEWLDEADEVRADKMGSMFPSMNLQARLGLIKVLIRQGKHAEAKELTDATATFLEQIKSELPDDAASWESLPDFHLQLSNFYHSFENEPQCRHHESQQIVTLERVAKQALHPLAGQLKVVSGLIERAEIFAERGNDIAATQQFELAEAAIQHAVESSPKDISVSRTSADLSSARGRFAMDRQDYTFALRHFDEAVNGNPTAANRSIRILCMAQMKDDRTLYQLNAEVDKPIEADSLADLFRACGVLVADNMDAENQEDVITAAQQLMLKARSENIFLKPSVLARLRASRELRELNKYDDFNDDIDYLDASKAASESMP